MRAVTEDFAYTEGGRLVPITIDYGIISSSRNLTPPEDVYGSLDAPTGVLHALRQRRLATLAAVVENTVGLEDRMRDPNIAMNADEFNELKTKVEGLNAIAERLRPPL